MFRLIKFCDAVAAHCLTNAEVTQLRGWLDDNQDLVPRREIDGLLAFEAPLLAKAISIVRSEMSRSAADRYRR